MPGCCAEYVPFIFTCCYGGAGHCFRWRKRGDSLLPGVDKGVDLVIDLSRNDRAVDRGRTFSTRAQTLPMWGIPVTSHMTLIGSLRSVVVFEPKSRVHVNDGE